MLFTGHVKADFTEKLVRFEAVVIPDGELEFLTDKLLASKVHEHESLVPLRLTCAMYVACPLLVIRTAKSHINSSAPLNDLVHCVARWLNG